MKDGTSKSPRHTRDTEPDPACELRNILDRIADKWSLLVIYVLADGVHRFTQLRREIDGISQRMLTLTLRQLEREGLVRRTVFAVVPPRVDYELTPLGGITPMNLDGLMDVCRRCYRLDVSLRPNGRSTNLHAATPRGVDCSRPPPFGTRTSTPLIICRMNGKNTTGI